MNRVKRGGRKINKREKENGSKKSNPSHPQFIDRFVRWGSYFLSTRRWQFNQGLQGAINSCFKFVSCARLTFLAKFRTGLTCRANLNETVDKEG